MSTFALLWTLSSSLFFLIPAIIFKLASLELLFKSVVLILTADWILLGLVQWRLLNPYLTNAYTWGVVTIISGIIISAFWVITIGLGWFIFGLTAFSDKNFWALRFVLFLINLLVFFGLGYLFGWIQIQVLKQSIVLNETHYYPWKMAFYWLWNIPLSLIASVVITSSLGPFHKYPLFYIFTTLITFSLIAISNLKYSFKLEQILTASST
jgi:hypothetical protein